ncbi:hypothetical protein GCM10011396_38750 [Undibacterium terreum]|uniref:Uncharacterized protein n=1 Tax=Undibacterium terreum TaxID=1224302 RepID=A0A916UTJ4_9BURK|nr:hypothetical protein GCM10011396_38750 [Undibacterium terreum]
MNVCSCTEFVAYVGLGTVVCRFAGVTPGVETGGVTELVAPVEPPPQAVNTKEDAIEISVRFVFTGLPLEKIVVQLGYC